MRRCDFCGDAVDVTVVCATCPKELCGCCVVGPDLVCADCWDRERRQPVIAPLDAQVAALLLTGALIGVRAVLEGK